MISCAKLFQLEILSFSTHLVTRSTNGAEFPSNVGLNLLVRQPKIKMFVIKTPRIDLKQFRARLYGTYNPALEGFFITLLHIRYYVVHLALQ